MGIDTTLHSPAASLEGADGTTQIAAFYVGLLGRSPDAEGLAGWSAALASGKSLAELATGFLNAAEVQSKFGLLDDGAFVDQLYSTVLGREADAAGRTAWVAAVQAQGREAVTVGILQSQEFAQKLVASPGNEGVVQIIDLTEPLDLAIEAAKVPTTSSGAATGTASPGGALLTSYTSGKAGGFNITVDFKGTWTSALQSAFVKAAERISAIVTGDLADAWVKSSTGSLTYVDDLRISAELKAIDGTGGVLGQAGPTAVRSANYLPVTAMMQFDSADASSYNSQGLWDAIVTHEMLHSLGFGSIWSYKGLASGGSYYGANGVAAYKTLVQQYQASHGGSLTLANGATLPTNAVPLETTGGSGTAGSHWSEKIFDTEMMTGYIDTKDPLSLLTVAALKDLGYVVSTVGNTAIDGYALA